MLGWLQLGLQFLFSFFNVPVHLVPLLFLHLIKSFPTRWELKLKCPGLSKTWLLFSFPAEKMQVLSINLNYSIPLIRTFSCLQQYQRKETNPLSYVWLQNDSLLTYSTLESFAAVFQKGHPHHQSVLQVPQWQDRVFWKKWRNC